MAGRKWDVGMDTDNEATQPEETADTITGWENETTRPGQAAPDDPFGYRAMYLQSQAQGWQPILLAGAGGAGIALAVVWFLAMKDEALKHLAWLLLLLALLFLAMAAWPQIGKTGPAPA